MTDEPRHDASVALEEAMLALITEQPWHRITARMPSDRANMPRSELDRLYGTRTSLLDAAFARLERRLTANATAHATASATANATARATTSTTADANGGIPAFPRLAALIEHVASVGELFARNHAFTAGFEVSSRYAALVRALVARDVAAMPGPPLALSEETLTFVAGGIHDSLAVWSADPRQRAPERLEAELAAATLALARAWPSA